MIPSLRSIASDLLEEVTLAVCTIEDAQLDRAAFLTLDSVLIRFKSLRHVNITYAFDSWNADPDLEEAAIPAFFESALPRCFAHGVLRITDGGRIGPWIVEEDVDADDQ